MAAAIGLTDVVREGAAALEPYAGRGVINTGAVTFHGVVDDYLYRACSAVGDGDADRWRHSAQSAYRRVGASWWHRALGPVQARHSAPAPPIALRRDDTGGWTVGYDGTTFGLADLKGLHYLRSLIERPGIDDEALALSDAVSGHPESFQVLEEVFCLLFSACEHAHDIVRADQWIRVGEQIAAQRRLPSVSAFCQSHYGGVLTVAGRWDEADAALTEAVRLWELGWKSLRPGALARLAELRVRQGRFEEAALAG